MCDGLRRHVDRDVKDGHRQRRHQGRWLGVRGVRDPLLRRPPSPSLYCSSYGLIERDFPEITQPPVTLRLEGMELFRKKHSLATCLGRQLRG